MDIKGFKERDGTVHQYDFGSLANKPKDPADGKDGGYYTPVVTQLDDDTVQFEFTPSRDGMPAVAPVTVELPGGSGEDSGQNVNVDATLTVSGAAADAKTTGDKITLLERKITGASTAIDYDKNVKAINHRGYCTTAPENTIPAFILSKQMGFSYVEADVSFTSDGVAVLLHDSTIDRTSDGSGNISAMTYAEVAQYDFGSWKSADYAGTKIPTFAEFLKTCKGLGLHPYIELKSNGSYTEEQIASIVAEVKAHGMRGKVTYISFTNTFLGYVKNANASARLGYLADVTDSTISAALALKTDTNEVFMDVSYSNITDEKVSLCITNDLPLELWTVNGASTIENMNPYVSGVTSDSLIAGKILYDKYMTYEAPDEPVIPEVTLNSISATYSGGSVPVGTAVSALTGVVVTAHYSDGTIKTVTGYTLSGTIAEGINTVIVTYQAKNTTFTVTGVAESGGGSGEDSGGTVETLLYSWDFTNNNLTDSVKGVVATHYTEQRENGLAFIRNGDWIKLGESSYNMQNKTVEIDVVSSACEGADLSKYARLFCIASENKVATNSASAAFLWGNNSRKWELYSGTAWGDSYEDLAVDFFSGKTVTLYFDEDMYCTLYVDGVSYGKSSIPSAYTDGWLVLGCSFADFMHQYNFVIGGVRIYDGQKS